ncbi:hypothetical protein AV530_018655 [Patagioenas fasciata monilis]|uniref:Uncharacterized protein n=1 Tax=Patagioenas fasciata monilis TaxID=372326 RepID=A0A1V4JTM7_PATFA|nr:hypothetical protein AV530_018655 [Patagioenas fasciata monilis]
MLQDARQWLNSGRIEDIKQPRTGATALHVAAAKGYSEVMRLLIQAGFNLNVQDNDGWTPLHAAAHWGVKEACSILAEALCDMDIRNKLVSTRRCCHNICNVFYVNFITCHLIQCHDKVTW